MTIKNIIFDWSGTLSNDLIPVYNATMLVFQKLGKNPITLEEYRSEFTLPYMIFWNKYFPELTKEEGEKFFKKAIYQVEEPVLYPGVKTEMKRLKSLYIKMVVLSSHLHEKLIKEISDYGLQSMFQEIKGSVHDKTETIIEIMKRNKFDPKQTMYVGDMTHDIDAGKKAKITTVAIGWGYQTRDKLMTANPDHIISNISELENFIK